MIFVELIEGVEINEESKTQTNKESKIGMSVLTSSEYNIYLHIPQKRKTWKLLFFLRMVKEELSFILENNGSLTNKRETFVKRHNHTTTTSHTNRKVWVELTIFFKIRILGQFPDKYHGCCTFHLNFLVGDIVFEGDY